VRSAFSRGATAEVLTDREDSSSSGARAAAERSGGLARAAAVLYSGVDTQ